MDYLKPIFEFLEFLMNFWWLWILMAILGVWKAAELIFYFIHHIKLN